MYLPPFRLVFFDLEFSGTAGFLLSPVEADTVASAGSPVSYGNLGCDGAYNGYYQHKGSSYGKNDLYIDIYGPDRILAFL